MWRCRRTAQGSERRARARQPAARLRTAHGVSLLELLIVVVLLSLFAGALYETVITGLRTVHASDRREGIRLQLANALDRFTREAGLANTVDRAQDQRFQFDADVDGDGNDEDNINYEVQNGVLERSYGGDTVTLVPELASLDFEYVDANGTSWASCDYTSNCGTRCCRSNARVVRVTMTATKDHETISVTSAAHLRNR